MDFALTEEQEATRDLAHQILTDRETHEHLKEIEAGGEGFEIFGGPHGLYGDEPFFDV